MTTRFISRELRKQVIKRDDYKCQYCNKDADWGYKHENEYYQVFGIDDFLSIRCGLNNKDASISFEIDHVIPHFFGGATNIDNLILACRSCNRSKGIKFDWLV